MVARLAALACVQLALASICGTVWAGGNEEAAVVLTPVDAVGDTLAYQVTISISGMVETRVVHLKFSYDGSALSFVGWENAEFVSTPLRIGPRLSDPPGEALIALAWKEPQRASALEVGTVRFLAEIPGDAEPVIGEAALVDRDYHADWIVRSGGQVRFARPAEQNTPARFAFRSVSPNPMLQSTTVSFEIPRPGGHVKIKIYDVRGREVCTLTDEHKAPGYYSEVWDLTNDRGRRVAPGIYFCRMEAGEFKDTKKVVLLR